MLINHQICLRFWGSEIRPKCCFFYILNQQKLVGSEETTQPASGIATIATWPASSPGVPGGSQKCGHGQSAEEDRGTVPGRFSGDAWDFDGWFIDMFECQSWKKFKILGIVQPRVGDILRYYIYIYVYDILYIIYILCMYYMYIIDITYIYIYITYYIISHIYIYILYVCIVWLFQESHFQPSKTPHGTSRD